MWQEGVVAALVAVAFGYTAWTLMPAAWRQVLRRRLGRPGAATDARGCGGCGGCAGASAPSKAGAAAVITVHRRVADASQAPMQR
jgi:hypothetical protein